uniref:Uncharacterized protein n=1 Tax=Anguilla anguilla TaxID=7936 RepID=A0A0E9R1W5_ANGAN
MPGNSPCSRPWVPGSV